MPPPREKNRCKRGHLVTGSNAIKRMRFMRRTKRFKATFSCRKCNILGLRRWWAQHGKRHNENKRKKRNRPPPKACVPRICPRGHLVDGDNKQVSHSKGKTYWTCLACKRLRARAYTKRDVTTLRPSYIRHLINRNKREQIPPELIELKRQQVQLVRAIKSWELPK